MNNNIIIFNAGSSSIKFSLFDAIDCGIIVHGEVDDIVGKPCLTVYDANKKHIYEKIGFPSGHKEALLQILLWYEKYDDTIIIAAGHRVVHGGLEFIEPVIITDDIMQKLEALTPLAPLHQPHNLEAIRIFAALHNDIPQIACFDTAFHRTQPKEAELFALPLKYYNEGILRYGFHGLSYQYIASILPDNVGSKIIVAHLGNGASMCAMKDKKSVATTMGFTALDGLMMGTRCGNIDAGVVLYLLEEKGMSLAEVTELLYKKSGLKGVSAISHNMRNLLKSKDKEAKEAVNLFCYQAAKQLAGLIPALGGLDAIIFTAGIGENAPQIRKDICKQLSWLGIKLCDNANNSNQLEISLSNSRIKIYTIPTNEELVIAMSVLQKL